MTVTIEEMRDYCESLIRRVVKRVYGKDASLKSYDEVKKLFYKDLRERKIT